MRDAGFYAHDVKLPIEVVQTHISFVVLTGSYAYKIKKPVNLGFLDFTTLDKRHLNCTEELRLNQAFSPELYLEVVPIYELNGHYMLNPTCEECTVFEYAVRMRQFDESQLLLNVFERSELDLDFAEGLGERIALIHKNAPIVNPSNYYGSADAMAESVRLNFEPIQSFSGNTIPKTLFDGLGAYMNMFIDKNRQLFDRRINEGRIRECHGDLHLSNICIYKGCIELFDRIEFNKEFRNIDAMYDLAFLLMDIRYRGRSDLAIRILNTYLEVTGDYRGALLLPFYQSMRALIRAEVALLLSADEDVDISHREEAKKNGVLYFEHALEYTQTLGGRLFVTCGLSGAGKSTVARCLAEGIDAVHIRSDAVRKHLAGVDLIERSKSIYTKAHTTATYTELIQLGISLARQGSTVILDATFDRREFRQTLIEKAESCDIHVQFIYCHAPLEVLKTRLSLREGDVSDATEKLIDYQAQQFEDFEKDEEQGRIFLDTQDENALKTLMDKLGGE